LLVSITAAKPSRDETDIMPNYVTKDGLVVAEKVRARVADNRMYQEQLFMLDLLTGSTNKLNYDTLPDFDTDVLAKVKAENYARQGKNINLRQKLDKFMFYKC